MYKDRKDAPSKAWVSEETSKYVDAKNSNDLETIKEAYGMTYTEIDDTESLEDIKLLETFIKHRLSQMTTNKSDFQTMKDLDSRVWDTDTEIARWDVHFVMPIEKAIVWSLESELWDAGVIYKLEPGALTDVNRIKPNEVVLDHFLVEDGTIDKMKEYRKYMLKYWFSVWFEGIESKNIEIKVYDGENKKFSWDFLKWRADKVIQKTKFNIGSRVVNVDNFWIDNNVNRFEDAVDCIELEELSKDEVLNRYNGDQYFQMETVISSLSDEMKAKVYHYYNTDRDIYAIMVNDFLIYEGANPYAHKKLPYFVSVLDPSPYHPYWTGWVIAKLRFAKPYINELFNITLKQVKNSNQPPLLMWEGVEFVKETPRFWVGKMWNFKGSINEIRELKVSSPDQTMFNVVEILQRFCIEMIWVNPQEVYSQPNITKFQIWVMEQSKNKRIWIYGRAIEVWYERLLNLRLDNLHYFLDLITVEEIVDPNLKTKQKPKRKKLMVDWVDIVKRTNDDWKEELDFNDLPGAYSEFELSEDAIRWNFKVKVITEANRPVLKELAKWDVSEVLQKIVELKNTAPEAVQWMDFSQIPKMLLDAYGIDVNSLVPDTKSKRIEEEINKILEEMASADEASGVDNVQLAQMMAELNGGSGAPVEPEAMAWVPTTQSAWFTPTGEQVMV